MILLAQIPNIAKDVHDDLSNGAAGTDQTLFNKTQTDLQVQVGATDIVLVDKTFSSFTVSATHLLDTTTGNGNTYSEFETNNGSVAYNRGVRAGSAKTSANELNIIHTFDFDVIL